MSIAIEILDAYLQQTLAEEKSSQDLLAEFMKSEAYEQQLRLVEERNKTVKHGGNIVHLEYLGGFTLDDLNVIEEEFQKADLVLSHRNSSWIWKASWEDLSLVSFIALTQPIVIEILKGIVPNATWDAIKSAATFAWGKLRGNTFQTIHSSGAEIKPIRFGLKVTLDHKTEFQFELSGDLDQAAFTLALDQVRAFLQTQKPKTEYQIPAFVQYSVQDGKWIVVDVMKAIQKEAKKKAAKTKKRKKK